MSCTQFIVAPIFILCRDAEMLADGYACILTDSAGNMFSTLDENMIDSLQGVLGVRPLPSTVKQSPQLPCSISFTVSLNPNIFHLWAYGTVSKAAPHPLTLGLKMPLSQSSNNSNDLCKLFPFVSFVCHKVGHGLSMPSRWPGHQVPRHIRTIYSS